MSTCIAGEPARGSTRYPVPIVTAGPRILWVTGTVLLMTMLMHIAVSLRKSATFAETGWLACRSVALILPAVRTRAWQRHLVGTRTTGYLGPSLTTVDPDYLLLKPATSGGEYQATPPAPGIKT
jgi:hypothetical protein